MNEQGYISKWKQIQETVLTNLLKGIPTNFIGSKLRTSLYSNIFGEIGKSVYIQYGVEFINTPCIKIGNNVQILRGVNLDASGDKNNKIYLADRVGLNYGVDIKALINTSIYMNLPSSVLMFVLLVLAILRLVKTV